VSRVSGDVWWCRVGSLDQSFTLVDATRWPCLMSDNGLVRLKCRHRDVSGISTIPESKQTEIVCSESVQVQFLVRETDPLVVEQQTRTEDLLFDLGCVGQVGKAVWHNNVK
jgi:hypothetical protein